MQTDDLFLGAFGLTRGGELRDVEVRGVNGRRVAFFQIEGDGMDEIERDYYRGSTSVNLQLLKLQVRRLKDLAFEAIRQKAIDGRRQAVEKERVSTLPTTVHRLPTVVKEEGRRDASESRGNRRDQRDAKR